MLAMTIGTARRAGSPQGMTHTVDAAGVLFGGPIVATGAVDRLGRNVVVRMFRRDIGMTTGTRVGAMDRRRKFRFIDKEPDRLARSVGLVQTFVGMAFEAGRVGVFLGSGS